MTGRVDARRGLRLRELRIHARVSAADLAKAVGISEATLHNYEIGRAHIPARRVSMISTILHIPVEEFFRHPGATLPRLRLGGKPKTKPLPPFGALSERLSTTDED